MTVSASAPRSRTRRRFDHCGRRRAAMLDHRRRDIELRHDQGAEAVQMPNGPKAAHEALAWLARQSSWQSMFADLQAGTRPVDDRTLL